MRLEGDWEGWLDFFLEGFAVIANEAFAELLFPRACGRAFGLVVERKPCLGEYDSHDGSCVGSRTWVVRMDRHDGGGEGHEQAQSRPHQDVAIQEKRHQVSFFLNQIGDRVVFDTE